MYPLLPPGARLSGPNLDRIFRPPDISAHFWKYPAKYPPIDLVDAHLAFFWSLADFRGRPDYPAQFCKYSTKYPALDLVDALCQLLVLIRFQGWPDYSAHFCKYLARNSAHKHC
jgi:hypothetical protein